MAEKSIEQKAQGIAQSRLEDGKEFEQMQSAQNQLLEIQAAKKQNLMEQQLVNNATDSQNQTLAQAAEVGAMSINQPTQGVLNKYGLQKPVTTSTTKQQSTVTRQNITINNNTTNITNSVPANIGGPIQGRGIQFTQGGDGNGGMSKFKDWITKTFQRQGEETRKRNLEYQKRESSLTKSSNKILRKLEDFSKSITKKLDPRRIGDSLGDGLKKVLLLFGIGYLAKNTTKILDGVEYIQESASGLFNWIKGGEKPKFIKDIGNAFGKLIFGEKYEKDFKDKGFLYAIYNERGTGVLNSFLKGLGDKLKENVDLANQYAGVSKLKDAFKLITDKKDYIGGLQAALGVLTSYLGILIGGKNGVQKALQAEVDRRGDNLGDSTKEVKRTADEIYDNVGYNGVKTVAAAGASAYVTNGNKSSGSYNIDNGRRDSKYGDRSAVRLAHGSVDRNGQLRESNMATMSVFSDLSAAFVDKNKEGAAETAVDDLRMIKQYSSTHEGPMLADLETFRGLSGNASYQGATYIPVARDWTYQEKYPADVAINHIASAAMSGVQAQVASKAVMGVAGAVSTTAVVATGVTTAVATGSVVAGGAAALGVGAAAVGWIPVVGWVAAAVMGVAALAFYLASPKVCAGGQAGIEALRYKAHAAMEKEKIIDYVKADKESLKKFWIIYGDYFVLTSVAGMNDMSLRGTVTDGEKGEYIIVCPDMNKVGDLVESAETVTLPDGGTTTIFKIREDWMSIFDDSYLDRILDLVRQKKVQSLQLAEVTDEMVDQLLDKYNLSNPYYDSSNTGDIAAFGRQYFGEKGRASLETKLSSINSAADSLGIQYTDNLQNQAGAFNTARRGETQMNRRVQTGIRDGTLLQEYHNGGSSSSSSGGGGTSTGGAIKIDFTAAPTTNTTTNPATATATPTSNAGGTPASGSGYAWDTAGGGTHAGGGGYEASYLTDLIMVSPYNGGPRKHKISKITIHHMAMVASAEACGRVFQKPGRNASSNYGIGNDGEVGLYVPENWRAWTSSSTVNDEVAVTIEVSNCQREGEWPVGEAALNKLILLCADICKRNGIDPVYTGTKEGTITEHRMFASTACPGPFLRRLIEGEDGNEGWLITEIKKAMNGNWKPDLDRLSKIQAELANCSWPIGGSGTGSGSSGDSGPLSVVSQVLAHAWESSKVYIKKLADGTFERIVGTENFMKKVRGDRYIPGSRTKKSISATTASTIERYLGGKSYSSGRDQSGTLGLYTGNRATGTNVLGPAGSSGLSYVASLVGGEDKIKGESTRRILSTLFNDKGELVITNRQELDPRIKESLEAIEAELKKQTEVDLGAIEMQAAAADSTMATALANTQATVQAIHGLTTTSVPRSRVHNDTI